jgi:acetylornithine deacetylase/succinyl-diaminopimelate desuccinylase-like protein
MSPTPDHLEDKILQLVDRYQQLAVELLREAVRLPADYVDRSPEEGGDPDCGLSNHEGPRLEYLQQKILELGAVVGPEDVGFDTFGNLRWTVSNPEDGVPAAEKTIVLLDGHTDTVKALGPRWHEAIGGGIDPYLGLTDPAKIDHGFLRRELGYLPPDGDWQHLIWGRGSADQLGGVVCQILATKILRELAADGALDGIVVASYATVAEEDNDGGGPMFFMRKSLESQDASRVPDVVILTEGTGCAIEGALGIYRGQRGRMQIEVEVTGKSCHGSMPWEGRNPLEFGAAIVAEAAERYAAGSGFGSDPFLGPGSRTASFAVLDTPSDCAVPERFTFRLDRRLTAGEDPAAAREDVESQPAVARAREAGLQVEVRVPVYDRTTWKGYRPDNSQIYPGWVTPVGHPAIAAAEETYRRIISPRVASDGQGGAQRSEPRVSRWVFSTDGVGVPVPVDDLSPELHAAKGWVPSGSFAHPAMFGIGPGIEQNTHKIGECVDSREIAPVIAFLARFPSLFRARGRE